MRDKVESQSCKDVKQEGCDEVKQKTKLGWGEVGMTGGNSDGDRALC